MTFEVANVKKQKEYLEVLTAAVCSVFVPKLNKPLPLTGGRCGNSATPFLLTEEKMVQAKGKQAQEMSVSPTLTINRDAAEKAIALVFPEKKIHSSDAHWKTGEQYTLMATLWDKYWDKDVTHTNSPIGVRAVVSWPEGQDEYGLVEVSSLPNFPRVERKFGCWKNTETGEVEVVKESKPPEMYQFWFAHGVKTPRGRKVKVHGTIKALMSGLVIVVVMALIALTDTQIFNTVESPSRFKVINWMLVLMSVTGGVAWCFTVGYLNERVRAISEAWVKEEKKMKELREKKKKDGKEKEQLHSAIVG
ncbi:MAG: hypothetical protein HYT93_04330 [Parcubacteria group bacterium]|nr:hypothetical protein [Parcubacteria group bacterium]